MMKLTTILMLVGLLAIADCKPEERKTTPEPPTQTSETPAAAATPRNVPEALQGMTTFNGTPSQDAHYYIYLQSASWCGPCCKEMPEIAAAYPEMKESGVELILIGCDDTAEASQRYLEKYHAQFPGIHYKDSALNTLPGFTPAKGIPDAIIVDREGHVIIREHGAIIKNWKQVIDRYEAQTKPTESPVQQPSAETTPAE